MIVSLRVWDLTTGSYTKQLTGDTEAVFGVVQLADGRVVSGINLIDSRETMVVMVVRVAMVSHALHVGTSTMMQICLYAWPNLNKHFYWALQADRERHKSMPSLPGILAASGSKSCISLWLFIMKSRLKRGREEQIQEREEDLEGQLPGRGKGNVEQVRIPDQRPDQRPEQ